MKRRPRPTAVVAFAGLTATTVASPRAGVATIVLCGALLFAGARRSAIGVLIVMAIIVLLIGPPTPAGRDRALPVHHAEAAHAR